MSLSKVREKIEWNFKIIDEVIEDNIAANVGLQMRKNQAKLSLEELFVLEQSLLKDNSKLFLVQAGPETIEKLKDNGIFAADHLSLATRLATRIWPSLKVGDTTTGFQASQLNELLDDVCGEIGVDNYVRPRLILSQRHTVVLSSQEDFVIVVERLLEDCLKSLDTEDEGHRVQAIYTNKQLLEQFRKGTSSDTVNFVVAVPSFSKDLIEAYKTYTSNNIYTVVIDKASDVSELDQILTAVGGPVKRTAKEKKTKNVK